MITIHEAEIVQRGATHFGLKPREVDSIEVKVRCDGRREVFALGKKVVTIRTLLLIALSLVSAAAQADDWPASMYGTSIVDAVERWEAREAQFTRRNPPMRMVRVDDDSASFAMIRKRPGYSQHMLVANPRYQFWSESRLQHRFPETYRRLEQLKRAGLEFAFREHYWGADLVKFSTQRECE